MVSTRALIGMVAPLEASENVSTRALRGMAGFARSPRGCLRERSEDGGLRSKFLRMSRPRDRSYRRSSRCDFYEVVVGAHEVGLRSTYEFGIDGIDPLGSPQLDSTGSVGGNEFGFELLEAVFLRELVEDGRDEDFVGTKALCVGGSGRLIDHGHERVELESGRG